MFAGIDLGTTFIKDHIGNIYPSGISENTYMASTIFSVEDKEYAVELQNSHAQFDINMNKGLNRNARINFLYALHRLDGEEYDNCFTCLPCSCWKSNEMVENFKEYLSTNIPIKTCLNNGLPKMIKVNNIEVLPEGSCSYYSNEMDNQRFNGRKVLVLDIGALTINQILFEQDTYVDCHTDEFGILKVYKDMAEVITTHTGYDIKYTDIFDILQNGLTIDGKEITVESKIKDVALMYCENIYKNLKLKWSINTIPYIAMIGAGSITLYKYLKNYIPHAFLTLNPQNINALGMGALVGLGVNR